MYEDVYTDPGSPLTRRTRHGTSILAKLDGQRKLLMAGSGAGPEGNKPFLVGGQSGHCLSLLEWGGGGGVWGGLRPFASPAPPARPLVRMQ